MGQHPFSPQGLVPLSEGCAEVQVLQVLRARPLVPVLPVLPVAWFLYPEASTAPEWPARVARPREVQEVPVPCYRYLGPFWGTGSTGTTRISALGPLAQKRSQYREQNFPEKGPHVPRVDAKRRSRPEPRPHLRNAQSAAHSAAALRYRYHAHSSPRGSGTSRSSHAPGAGGTGTSALLSR